MTKQPMSEKRLAEIADRLGLTDATESDDLIEELIVEVERLSDENGAFRDALEFCRITSTELEVFEQCKSVLEDCSDD